MTVEIEKGIEHPTTHCDCCGRATRSLNGYAYAGGSAIAAYMVRWTDGHVAENGASFDLIIGEWGGAPSSARVAVSLDYRVTDTGPAFMVIDANTQPVAKSDLVGRALSRNEVIGTATAKTAFDILDAILLQDDRVAPVIDDWRILSEDQQ